MDAFTRRVASGCSLRFCVRLAVAALCLGGLARPACAQYYWATTGTGLWTDAANWSSNATSGGTPGTVPPSSTGGAAAVFNQTSVSGNSTAELTAARSINGLSFLNTGTTRIRLNAAGSQALTVGASGIVMSAGAGPATIGDATNRVPVVMNGFPLTNHSSSLLTLANGLSTGANGLTVNGTGSGGVQIDGDFNMGGAYLTKSGSGTLRLTGSSTFAWLTITSGTFEIGGAGSMGTLNANGVDEPYGRPGTRYWWYPNWDIRLSNTSAFVYSSSANQALAPNAGIVGPGSLTMAGSGMLTLVTANSYTGLTTISSGTLVANGSPTGGDIVNNATLVLNNSGNITYSRAITGTGALIKTRSGVTTFAAANAFSGPVAIQGGEVVLDFRTATSPLSNILSSQSVVTMGANLSSATPAVTNGNAVAYSRPDTWSSFTVTGSAGLSNSQTLAGMTVTDNLASVSVTSPNTNSMTLDVGSLTRTAAGRGLVVFTPSATGSASILTKTANTNGIIGPWALVSTSGTLDWATSAASGGTSAALTRFSTYVTNTFASGSHTNLTASTTAPAGAVTESLRFGGASIGLTLAGTTTVTSGGILLAGKHATTPSISGGALRGAPGTGLLIAGNGGDWHILSISSPIVDNGGPSDLTLATWGNPFYGVDLRGNSTYTGRTLLRNNETRLNSFETGTSGPLGVGGAIEFPSNGATSAGSGLGYNPLNSADYSSRFTSAPNQTYTASIPAGQTVVWASNIGSDSAALGATGSGRLVLTGSNSFPNGVNMPAALVLGSANAVGSSGVIYGNGGIYASGPPARIVFTPASAGLDLGSRLNASNAIFGLDTNGQTVTFATAANIGNPADFMKMGDGRLTFSGGLTVRQIFLVGGTLALDSTSVATPLTSTGGGVSAWGVNTLQLIGAAGASRVQNIDGLSLYGGMTTLAVQNPGTSTRLNIVGTISRPTTNNGSSHYWAQFGTVDLRAVGGGFGTTAVVTTATTQPTTNGILGPWATVDGSDWATHQTGTIQAYTAYTDVAGDSIADGVASNARIASTGGTVSLSATTTTVNTLLQSAPTAATINLAGQTLATGGVMVGRTAGRLVIGSTVGDGTLQPTAAGGEVILTNFGSGSMTVNSVIANNTSASRLTISGNGRIVLTATNTLSGTAGLQGGTLQIGDGGTTGSLAVGTVALAAGATLVFNRSDNYGGTVSYPILSSAPQIGGPGGVVVQAGDLTLSGNSTYYGTTLLAGGTVTLANANGLSSRTDEIISFTGGVLRYGSGITQDLSARIANSTAPIVVDTNGQSVTWSYGVVASNTVGLTKRGTGTLTFGNANSYLGTTTIEAGVLQGSPRSFPGDIVNSGTLIYTNNILRVSGGHAGAISGTGAVLVNGTTFLPVLLSGTSTYAAVPVVQQGRLDIGWTAPAGQASPLGTSGTVSLGTTGIGGMLGYSGATDLTFDRILSLPGTTIGAGLAADGAGAFIVTSNLSVVGAGSKTFTLDGRGTASNEMRGVIANQGGANLTSLAKTGPGLWRLTAVNTYTGSTTISEGTLSVDTLTNVGVNGPLGAPASGNATISLGSALAPAALRYTGTGHSTNRGVILTGTGILEAMGSGAATFSTVTGSAGANTLVLGGTSVANNTLGVISDAPSPGVTSVVKDGSGLWRLTVSSSFTGGLTVRQGTVIADVNSGGQGQVGAFGTADAVTVGDATAGAVGTAALLLAPGVRVSRQVLVPAATGGGTQTVLLGSTGTSGLPGAFEGDAVIQLGRAVTLVAVAGGTANFSNTWSNFGNTGTTNANIAVGSAAYPGTVLVNNNLATQGLVNVRFGRLDVAMGKTVTATGGLSIDAPGTLVGSGVIAATLGGAGLVAPGNSPGILTAQAVDPTGGLDWAFELTGTAPNYGDASASVNDILRLTGTAAAPFTAGLNATNVVSLYFAANPTLGEVYQGGFFTDSGTATFGNFGQLVTSGSFVGYYKQAGGAYTHNGENYALLSTLGLGVEPGVTTVASAGFDGGNTTITGGQVTTFTVVVPEPGSLALVGLGLGLAGWALRRRRAL
jgi:autotransporter-associated beta strand protein